MIIRSFQLQYLIDQIVRQQKGSEFCLVDDIFQSILPESIVQRDRRYSHMHVGNMLKKPLLSILGLDSNKSESRVLSCNLWYKIKSLASRCDEFSCLTNFLDGHPLVCVADQCTQEWVIWLFIYLSHQALVHCLNLTIVRP